MSDHAREAEVQLHLTEMDRSSTSRETQQARTLGVIAHALLAIHEDLARLVEGK